jgi:hypothetical protein
MKTSNGKIFIKRRYYCRLCTLDDIIWRNIVGDDSFYQLGIIQSFNWKYFYWKRFGIWAQTKGKIHQYKRGFNHGTISNISSIIISQMYSKTQQQLKEFLEQIHKLAEGGRISLSYIHIVYPIPQGSNLMLIYWSINIPDY